MTETRETQPNYCRDLLGLYFTTPDSAKDEYVHAFSFKKDVLENMIETNVLSQEKSYYSIQPISLFCNYILDFYIVESTRTLINANNMKYKDISHPIYGLNHTRIDGKCVQILISTNVITDVMEKNGISAVPLKIDTFYEEGILNASRGDGSLS